MRYFRRYLTVVVARLLLIKIPDAILEAWDFDNEDEDEQVKSLIFCTLVSQREEQLIKLLTFQWFQITLEPRMFFYP